jgi:hypothetical protein
MPQFALFRPSTSRVSFVLFIESTQNLLVANPYMFHQLR